MSETNELADHKQRLAAQSARLAAAESEVRRLRRVIEVAPCVRGKWLSGAFVSFETDGHAPDNHPSYVAKLVPIDELEASNAG